MNFSVIDILIVTGIGILAVAFLAYTIFKMHKNKKLSLCNGCSSDGCSTKVFSATPELNSTKELHFYNNAYNTHKR